jgi:acyl-coenzyme A thioesterase PaaI-like protein
MNANLLRHGMNLWPPFWGAGIKVQYISPDFRNAKVKLRHGLINRNIVGVHFGGSLFAMTDPFFMLMVSENLGHEYTVWDRAAHIEFLKPGKGDVYAEFALSQNEIESLKSEASAGYKILRDFSVDVLDRYGDVVAHITKTLYIRKKLSSN